MSNPNDIQAFLTDEVETLKSQYLERVEQAKEAHLPHDKARFEQKVKVAKALLSQGHSRLFFKVRTKVIEKYAIALLAHPELSLSYRELLLVFKVSLGVTFSAIGTLKGQFSGHSKSHKLFCNKKAKKEMEQLGIKKHQTSEAKRFVRAINRRTQLITELKKEVAKCEKEYRKWKKAR